MKVDNILLKGSVTIDPSSAINNVEIGDNVKIAKRCSVFGSPEYILAIGDNSYIGMNTLINGYSEKVTIGNNVSIAQNVNIMSDSGPNASLLLQKIYPIQKKPIVIGNDCWIGASSIIMPGVKLGNFCVVAAHSFVTGVFDDYSIIGGCPAKVIKKIDPNMVDKE